mmetsp:Transcript_72712/g.187594  ORF Transcript_72712/g.187594 Transcript_72712/m.187594 type:complete len:239 (-) Transcript_72712:237-953(-)
MKPSMPALLPHARAVSAQRWAEICPKWRYGERPEVASRLGSFRDFSYSASRFALQNAFSLARPAFAPGAKPATGFTERSTWSDFSAACQLTFGGKAAAGGGNGCTSSAGIGPRNSGSCLVILGLMVRAAYSSLSEATQTGTTLCASTWWTAIFFVASEAATSFAQAMGTLSGDMSHTTTFTFSFAHSFGTSSFAMPSFRKKGTFFFLRVSSTSRSPVSMKLNCRMVASRNFGTRQKTT